MVCLLLFQKFKIKKMRLLIVGMAVFVSGILYSQNIILISGSLDYLKGQTKFMIKYDYVGMAVGKYIKESDYIDETVNEKNEDKPGTGDEWREEWFSNRTEKFHPAFESALNKKLKKRGVTVGCLFEDAQFTILIKLVKIEPGYIDFGNEESPSISVKIIFFETSNPGSELAQIAIPICRGPYGSRLEDKLKLAYTRTGNCLGEYLIEEIFIK